MVRLTPPAALARFCPFGLVANAVEHVSRTRGPSASLAVTIYWFVGADAGGQRLGDIFVIRTSFIGQLSAPSLAS